MRFDYDTQKSDYLKRERGFSLSDAAAIFDGDYFTTTKSDDPEQYAAIGFSKGTLLTLIFEYREDDLGELIWLITYWKATKREVKIYEEFRKK